jgi:8-oxo-dGTP pyrophosphatase MutT (NUDIX family)
MLASEAQAIRRELSERPGYRVDAVKDDTLSTLVVWIYDPGNQHVYQFWSWEVWRDWWWDRQHGILSRRGFTGG